MDQKRLRNITVLGLLIAVYAFIMIKYGPTLWSILALLITVLTAVYVIFVKGKESNNESSKDDNIMNEYMYNVPKAAEDKASEETSNPDELQEIAAEVVKETDKQVVSDEDGKSIDGNAE